MLVDLQIQQLRNISRARLQPGPTFNLICGDNGSGKSSVLEAVHVLGLGRSFRSRSLDRLIRHEQDETVLFAKVASQGRELPLGLSRSRAGTTRIRLAGETLEKLSELATILPQQLITPESFQLLTEGPKQRRQFLDWGAFHCEEAFLDTWSRYNRILRQRNALLKQARSYSELKVWDRELAVQGEFLAKLRENYLNALRPALENLIARFLPDYPITLSIGRGWREQAQLTDLLADQFERERRLGYTTVGPHKAELKIRTDGKPVQEILSRGQLKLLVCALRIAQGQHYAQHSGQPCLFLIDDLPSELDSERRRLLLSALAETDTQVFITSIEPDPVLALLPDPDACRVFTINQGRIDDATNQI